MKKRLVPRPIVLAAACTVILSLTNCTPESSLQSEDVRAAVPSGAVVSEALEYFGFERLSDWRKADLVTVATVIQEKARRVPNPPLPEEERLLLGETVVRDLVLQIEEVIRGRAPADNRFAFQENGWVERNGQRTPHVLEGRLWLEVGDRVIIALTGNGEDPDKSGLFTGTSVFVLKDGQVQDTDRRAPVVRELEGHSEQELKDRARREAG